MKKVIILLLLYHISNALGAQDWIRYYGYGQHPHSAYCIEQYDKGFILLGNINNYKYGWIVKTDINGNQLWDLKIGDGINQTMPSNIEQTSDHGFILCGTTSIYSSPHTDPFIMKLNSCGGLEWCKVLNYDSLSSGGYGVKETIDGGYVMLAEFYGNDPNDRIHLFKFDSGGELFWHKVYNRDSIISGEILRSLYIDSTNFLITAFCYYPNWMKPYFIQTDTSGNEIWRLVFSLHTGLGYVGDAWVSVRDIHGNYYSAGSRDGPELLKFSGNGYEIMNADLFPGAISGNAVSILGLSVSSFVLVSGWTYNGITSYLAVLKTDTLGTILNQHNLPNPENTVISNSIKTFNDKILIIGTDNIGASSRITLFKLNSNLEYDSIYTRPFTYDSLCQDTIISHTITPNCGVLVNVDEPLTNPKTIELKVFPNPSNQKITIEFPKYIVVKTGQSGFGSTTVYHHWKSTILEVYDLSGNRVFEKEIIRAVNSLELDVSQWTHGMYNFRLRYNRQTIASEKVILQ